MARRASVVEWATNDGRNDSDHPLYVADTQSVESLNVTLKKGHLAIKRPGSADVAIAGDAFVGGAAHLAKFLPGNDLTAVELFIVSAARHILRVVGDVADDLALLDAFESPGTTDGNLAAAVQVTTAHLNNKLFIAYNSGVNRMHVYDPATSTTTVRRAGLPAVTAAPVVSNVGTGTYPATTRWYREAWRLKSGTRLLRQGEMSAATAFTPSGTGSGVQVNRPPAPAGEITAPGTAFWVVYGSADDDVYYELAELADTVASYVDTELVSAYSLHPAAPLDGSNFPFPSVRFIATDGVRLFGLGQWELTPGETLLVQHGTAYWSPPIGSSEIGTTVGVGDDERTQSTVDQDDHLPLSVSAGHVDRGISGPFYNSMYFFQDRGIYKLVATDNALAPFRRVTVTRFFGSVSHWAQVIGEDESGNECLYFLDPHDGPRRIVVGDGVQWIGEDCSTFWQSVNLNATVQVAHGVYDRTEKQVKWWIAIGSDSFPISAMITYHVTLGHITTRADSVRGGWAKWTGQLAVAYTSLMFPITLDLPRPLHDCAYTGNALGVHRQDGTRVTDSGVPYQGYVLSKAWSWGLMVRRKRLLDTFITTEAASPGTTIRQTIVKDFGTETFPQDVLIETPLDTHASHLRAHVQGCDIADGLCDQVQIGDHGPVPNTWMLCRWDAIIDVEDAR